MYRRQFLQTTSLALATAGLENPATAATSVSEACDVFVYGSTPGGIAAAVEAARRGCKVVLACPKRHAGGMKASGLCFADAVRPELFGGIVAEFFSNVRKEYERTLGRQSPDWSLIQNGWRVEPSVAERHFDRMLEGEAEQVEFKRAHYLLRASVQDGRVVHVDLESPEGQRLRISARTFIDGTYEGDLAAAAGVPYRVGREGREEFGESLAGIHYMDWKTGRQIVTADTGEPSPAMPAASPVPQEADFDRFVS